MEECQFYRDTSFPFLCSVHVRYSPLLQSVFIFPVSLVLFSIIYCTHTKTRIKVLVHIPRAYVKKKIQDRDIGGFFLPYHLLQVFCLTFETVFDSEAVFDSWISGRSNCIHTSSLDILKKVNLMNQVKAVRSTLLEK